MPTSKSVAGLVRKGTAEAQLYAISHPNEGVHFSSNCALARRGWVWKCGQRQRS